MNKLKKIIVVLGFTLFIVSIFIFIPPKASADSLNYTNHLMDDSIYRASFTMTAQDIQNFLVSKNSGLVNFRDVENCGSSTGSNYAFYAKYYSCGTTQVAAQIIYDSAQAYGINPQIILATLQKEQSLVTTPNPTSSQLTYAMGYGCPDSGGCSNPGFFNQVDNGTWQLRTDYELSIGNNYWGYTPASYPCNGATQYYSAALLPGSNVTFKDDSGTAYANFIIPNASTASLYCYTPHVFPGSSNQYYSGSYWFVYYYSQWFGGTIVPYAFKSSTSNTVYLFVNGYKIAVPTMAMLQDYGVSPGSIMTFSQARVDAITTPSVSVNGVSPTLSYLIQAPPSAAVYLVGVGTKSTVTSMQQFNDFGFSTANISYLPITFIASINGSSNLSNYVTTPTNNAFVVSGGQKRIIFDYSTYTNLNPSNQNSAISSSIAGTIPSGAPYTNREILIQPNSSPNVYLLLNGSYYSISSQDIYNCWGFAGVLNTPEYTIADNSYIAPINSTMTLNNCLLNNGIGSTYLLNTNNKLLVPSALGSFSSQTADQNLLSLLNKITNSNSPLSNLIKVTNLQTIWFFENGIFKPIPSYSDFNILGLNLNQLSILNSSVLSSLTFGGVKLGNGQVVSSPGDTAVYVIYDNTRIPIPSGDEYLAYGYQWNNIEVFPSSLLDQYYPKSSGALSQYLYNAQNNQVYLMDRYGCYALSPAQLLSYGQVFSSITTSQNYQPSLFPYLNLARCQYGSTNVIQAGQAAVYQLNLGSKSAYSSWNSLLSSNNNSVPLIITLSTYNINSLSLGPAI